jgi:adenosylhomocysteine nucleosidase
LGSRRFPQQFNQFIIFLNPPLPGFVVALANEWKYFRDAFSDLHGGRCHGLPQYRGRYGGMDCLAVIGGAGRENAAAAARTLVEHHPVNALISMGYAGALSPELARGDIALSAYSFTQKNPEITSWERNLEQNLRRVADQCRRHRVHVGPLHTAGRIVARHEDKRRIHEETGAGVADMESISIFKVAREKQIPFLGIHSITDTADEDIPALEAITPFLASKSMWRYPRIFLDIVAHPGFIHDLAALHRDARIAGKNLVRFMKSNEAILGELIKNCVQAYPKTPPSGIHFPS